MKATITLEDGRQFAAEVDEAGNVIMVHKDGVYYFSQDHHIDTNMDNEKPLFIGNGLAPDGLENKCLFVHYNWEMETMNHNGYTVLTFKQKQ